MLLHLVSVILLGSTVQAHDNVGLRFGNDLSSYIMINPNMIRVEKNLAVCAWVKQVRPANQQGAWLHYRTDAYSDEITISDNLGWAYLLQDNTAHSTTPPISEWYHVCITFSFVTRTKSLFFNGQKIGSETTPSGRKLSVTTGSLVIGQYHSTYKMEASFYSSHPFGGELAKLNIFTRSLLDQEVADMYSSGICSSYEDSLTEDTFLSWDTLLSEETEKHGNIVKFNLTCKTHTHSPGPTTAQPTTAEPTTAQPTQEHGNNCHNRWGFLQLSEFKDEVGIFSSSCHCNRIIITYSGLWESDYFYQ